MNIEDFSKRFLQLKQVPPEPDYPLQTAGKPAGVLVPIVQRTSGLTLLLTQRAAHLKHHAGQISFPGGKQEPADSNLAVTALRETQEEIGIDPTLIQIIGRLPNYRTISRFDVIPYIAMIKPNFELTLDHNEVENAFELPLEYVLDQRNHLIHWAERHNQRWPMYFIPWRDKMIWGATAAFIRNLSNICKL